MRGSLTRRRLLGIATGALVAACGGDSESKLSSEVPTLSGSPEPTSTAIPPATMTPTPRQVRLRYIRGSTVKVEQVIGDYDNQLKKPTVNQTGKRFGIPGTDLGNSFEHNGKVYFLFGDVLAAGPNDPIGFSDSTDPAAPLQLDFITDSRGRFLPVAPPGIDMRGWNVPSAGISLNGEMYVAVITDSLDWSKVSSETTPKGRSVLTRYNEQARTFTVLREMSKLPGGRFIDMTWLLLPDGLAGLPVGGPSVLMFGTGAPTGGAVSNPYLATVPIAGFVSGETTRYFAGLSGDVPQWSELESDAWPLFFEGIRNVSVTYVAELGLWVMLYRIPTVPGPPLPVRIHLRYAPSPWGPWSSPEKLFSGVRDPGFGVFIHDTGKDPDDGLAGPLPDPAASDPKTIRGHLYAPFLIERFTRVVSKSLTLDYLASTWNPYVVVRMRSTLAIER